MENYTDEQLSQLTDDQLFDLRAELLKGLDDDLASGTHEPQTLAAADRLAEKLPNRLYENDNGFFDFDSPLNEESLQAAMADMRINFSREKVEFACKVIAALNAEKEPQRSASQAVEESVAPLPPSVETAPEPAAEESASETPVREAPAAPKPAPDGEKGVPPRPPKPNAAPPSGWSDLKDRRAGSAKTTPSPRRPSVGGSKIPPRKIGFWERLFGSVGRRSYLLVEKLFK